MKTKINDNYIIEFIDKHLDEIKSTYEPKGLWFFGSRVSGKPKNDSDIDLILVSDKFKGRRFIHRMGDFLKTFDFPKHIDALCYTPEEFEEKRRETGIIKEAIEKGRKVI